jgi:hypothetical protein
MPSIVSSTRSDDDDLSDREESEKAEEVEAQASAATSPSPQDREKMASNAVLNQQTRDPDFDEVANYVNFHKFLSKDSANYYYSPANKSVREKLDKVKSTKAIGRSSSLVDFDDSAHGRIAVLSERSRSSAYRGPQRTKSDGSAIKPVMKKRASDLSLNDSYSLGTASAPPTTNMHRNVSFSHVNIREHERIAGDNPCVTSGVPLSIGWGSIQHPAINLDHYEKSKGPSRDKIEMMVPAAVRKQMLRDEFGVSLKEMNEAIKTVNITKRNRRHTVASEHMEGWGEVMQSAKRKFGRLVKKTSTKKEEEKLWDTAHKAAMKQYLTSHGSGSLGKDPESAGSGEVGVGPVIVVEEEGTPIKEISYRRSGSGDSPPQF